MSKKKSQQDNYIEDLTKWQREQYMPHGYANPSHPIQGYKKNKPHSQTTKSVGYIVFGIILAVIIVFSILTIIK